MKIISQTTSLEEMGGKGYQLSLLNNICKVPDFFVLSFENDNEIDDINNQNKILEYFDEHNFEIVSVRSSATKEDSFSSSFAGMFETTLNVTRKQLLSEIKRIITFCNNKRVKQYCKLNNIDQENVKMRVVIQKMLDSRIAGVCFSKRSKTNDNLLIESCWGLGESIVSGTVSPDYYIVNRRNLNIDKIKVNYQSKMIKLKKGNETYEEVPNYKKYLQKASSKEIQYVAKTVLNIEQKLNYEAADVEWAYEGENLYILQSREYTGIK